VSGEGWLTVGEGAIYLAGSRLERFDLDGNRLWEVVLGGPAQGLVLVRGDHPTVTGAFQGQASFQQARTVASTGGTDGYVAQYDGQGQLTSVGARPVAYQPPAVTYNGLHKVSNPTAAQVTTELGVVKQHFASLRTYYPQYGGGTVDLGKITNQLGLKVYLGLFLFPGHNDWTAENYANYVKPAVARGNVSALIVGNEDPQDLALILSYLDKAHTDFPKLPASSAQTTTFWLTDSRAAQLADKVDFIAVNIYPGWDGVPWTQMNLQPVIGGKPATPADSFNSFKIIYGKLVAKYPGLPIVVTETGWPTTYGAPSPAPPQPKTGIANAKAYLTLVQNWAINNKKNVFIYGMYDDTNAVNTSSLFNYHFGLMDTDGNSKGVLF
jgi:exo-beta-1,3-glucanase (GH17 family)